MNHSLQINAPEETSYPEIWELLRTCISTNINISSAFFFNDSVSYINANSNQSLIQEYIEFSREHPERLNDSCWNIFTPSESQTPLLCYCVVYLVDESNSQEYGAQVLHCQFLFHEVDLLVETFEENKNYLKMRLSIL